MDDFLEKFAALDKEHKRNQLNVELQIIGELINKTEQVFNIPNILEVKNYDSNIHSNLSEDEMLEFLYEDVFNIERELITLLTFISNRK